MNFKEARKEGQRVLRMLRSTGKVWTVHVTRSERENGGFEVHWESGLYKLRYYFGLDCWTATFNDGDKYSCASHSNSPIIAVNKLICGVKSRDYVVF